MNPMIIASSFQKYVEIYVYVIYANVKVSSYLMLIKKEHSQVKNV